mgnify:CR=1 FL=1
MLQVAAGRMHRDGHNRVGGAVQDLPLEVARVNDVEVDDAERSHSRRCEVEPHGGAEADGAHEEDTGVLEPALPLHPHVGEEEVAEEEG